MDTLIHHSLTKWARDTPHAIAFRCREKQLSYSDLLARASQLANHLIELGIKPMDRVGIYMGKQIELPISAYGILLAGATYVPIDPNAPIDRIQFILQNCGISILLTHPSKQRQIPQIVGTESNPLKHIIGTKDTHSVPISAETWACLLDKPETPPSVEICEDDLAYIMYTSGSTGTPKGLMHTHRSGLAYARHSARLYQVSQDDILGNHAPLHFDISTFEFLTGPFAGATSVLIPEEDIMFPESLAELIERESLTFWYSVPLALTQLLTRVDLTQKDFSSLRWILFGGEPIPPLHLRDLQRVLPQAAFCNVYGPAEVNQCSYYHVPAPTETDESKPVPLGQIWDAAHALVLNRDDSPTPQGETGELLIASATMMHGYWARADLNASAFYYEEPVPGFTRRYYRTGDLVYIDSIGNYHFVGRKDRQVKLRGYRVELEEVEAAFTQQNAVEESAAFTVQPEGEETKSLFLAATVKPGYVTTEKDLLRSAQQHLPHYAVPARIIIVDHFPRTGSGKIDRNQLALDYA